MAIPDIKWPTALREARVRHLQSGASIRRPSARLPVFVAGRSTAAATDAVVVRIQGEVQKTMATLPGAVLGLAEAPDGRWLLASMVDEAAGNGGAPGGGGKPRLVGIVVDDRPGPTPQVSLDAGAGRAAAAGSAGGRVLEVQP